MHLIEPCCAHKHLSELRDVIGKNGTAEFEGYGDLSIKELLPPLVMHYNGTRLLIAAPVLPDQAADAIRIWMRKEWPFIDGSGKVPVITHLTIATDIRKKKSPLASSWLKDNPFGERMTLVDMRHDDTVILLPDFAIVGPVNMQYGENFTARATTKASEIEALWKQYEKPPAPVADRAEPEGAEAATTSQRTKQEDDQAII